MSPKAKKSRTKVRQDEGFEDIPAPVEVVEGFGDTHKTDSDFEDEPVPLAVKVLVLSCIEYLSS